VLRRIGGGRRYEAMLVWDEHRLAMLVAKVLRPDCATDQHALRDLAREAALLERLAHPVLVRSFGVVTDSRFPHLLLEHLEGPTLDELIARERGGDDASGRGSGPLALEQVLPLALHVASALHYLAAEGVVHLDVKPSNVVMGAPPRLIDLSVARTFAEAAAARGPVGTDAYMAPEQRAAGPLGPPADVWGLAATVHVALTGAPWLAGATARAVPLPRRTPAALRDVIAACLDPDPASRPTARAFAETLEPLVVALPRRLTLGRRS
jgi:eukaryotic-like serine/threonine-protein kinase